jgi:mRNA interferase MazF
MRRGDIWLFDLEPAQGSEANKVRPGIVVSNDGANHAAARSGSGVVTIIPLTSNTRAVYPFQALLQPAETGLASPSKAQAEQVRSVTVSRATRLVGSVPGSVMARVEEALRIHLGL